MENTKANSKQAGHDFAKLLNCLGHKNWKIRKEARIILEQNGREAAGHLIRILKEGSADARWQAAKAMITIKDKAAAPSLVSALCDESFEIQWLAAEALIALGEESIIPILEAPAKEPESQLLRQGAHQVLSDLERHGFLDRNTSLVLDNLRMIGPWEHVAVLAEKALNP